MGLWLYLGGDGARPSRCLREEHVGCVDEAVLGVRCTYSSELRELHCSTDADRVVAHAAARAALLDRAPSILELIDDAFTLRESLKTSETKKKVMWTPLSSKRTQDDWSYKRRQEEATSATWPWRVCRRWTLAWARTTRRGIPSSLILRRLPAFEGFQGRALFFVGKTLRRRLGQWWCAVALQ